VGVAVLATPLRGVVQARIGHEGSASLRLSLYQQSGQGALKSPIVGYGVPLPQPVSKYTLPNVGTQGQVWLVLVSVGIPGTVFFLVWLLYLFWASRSAADPVSFTVHVAILIALVQLPFYGWMPTEMFLIMATAALIWRSRAQSVLVSGPHEATSSRPLPALRG
jgi:O-antigen ligase